ncbi:TonB-dependent receptor [Marinilabiliaceae bacterium JC017]|nr:TonB-dependent receptor [Marinilabiliaceae bacterium JC017]
MKKIYIRTSAWLIAFLCMGSILQAQESKLKGHVTSNTGDELPGVNVFFKGTTTGTITDFSGNFSLALPAEIDKPILVVSFIGFKAQELNVGTTRYFDIVLEEENQLLEELVVVGYGVQKKADLTGSVSAVNMDQFEKTPVAGVDQALQGKAAGVVVSQTTGAPGEGVAVRIRGIGSINSGNAPLYIVDGVPTSDAMSSLAPTDIESISILKDAASAAVYGSRANNGVVLITTKKGKSGKARIQFNTLTGVQVHGPLTEMANKDQYIGIYNEAAINDNADIDNEILHRKLISDEEAAKYPDVDHLDQIFRRAMLHSYNLNVSGGNDKSQYLVSGNYFNQEGIIIGSDYERYSGKVSVSIDANDWIKVGTNVNVSRSNNNIIGSSGDGYGGNGGSVVRYALFRTPAIPVYDENGEFVDLPDHPEFFGDGYNPYGLIKNTSNKKESNKVFGDLYATISLVNELKLTSKLGFDHNGYNQRRFDKTWGTNNRINNPNTLTVSDGHFDSWSWSNVLNYNWDINNNHHLDFMLGSEAIKSQGNENFTSEKDFPDQDPNLVYLGNGRGVMTASEAKWSYGLLSFFSRVNYDYKGKYLLSATIREDGSSRFAEGNRWGTFYSGSLGWRIDREAFMANVEAISHWKLRMGVGFIGNQDVGYYAYSDLISPNKNYPFGGVSQDGYAKTVFGNENVKWETSSQYDVGMDLGFLQGMLNVSMDYFRKVSQDMLTKESIPTSAGYAEPAWVNKGKVLNQGVELEVGFRQTKGDFSYNITGNFSALKNEVLELASPIYGGRIDNGVYATKTEEGHSIGSFYLYEMEGIFQNETEIMTHAYQGSNIQPGDVKYKDQNKDGVIDEKDRTHVGSSIPDFNLGLNLGATYKNFDCSVFFQGAFGQEIYYQVATDIEGYYRPFNVTKRYVDEHWTGEGTSNTQPRASWRAKANNTRLSTRFLEDGSYLRLKNLQIGYTLPQHIAKKMSLEKCRLYFSGQNLWTLTDYPGLDPEMTTSDNSRSEGDRAAGIDWGTYPSAVSYNLGVQITF